MKEFCEWTRNEDGVYETECEHIFEINEGTPVENDMRFCCYCGAEIVAVAPPVNPEEVYSPHTKVLE